jgi:hypothetical protein
MIPLITLRGALADPALLGNSMPGPTFLPMQTLLIAGMGETLTDDERVIFTRLTGRPREPQRRVNELVIIKGRRAGGSLAMGKVIIPYLGGLCRWPALTGGERGVLLVLAQDQRTADQILDYAEDAFRASPMLSQLVEGRVQRTLRLTNGIDIEVRAADRRRLRGLTFVGVVADEFAHWPTDEWSANPDTEILNAVRPGLATTNGMSFLITSPYARRGEAWNIHKNDFGPNGNPLTLVAQGASRVFNSSLPQSFIDREYERDPAAAAAEYGAEFRLDVESFVSQEVVAAATVPGRFELPPISGVRYVAFTDPSGGSSDSMTLGIAHAEDDLVILDVTREVTPPFSPDVVVSDFAVLMKRYRIPSVTGDRWGGEFVREQFEKRGITYRLSEKVKSDIYRELLPLLNSGRIALLDLPRLANQLVGLERRTARGGRDSIDHAPKGHDDVINAVAGALVEAASGHAPMVIAPEVMARIHRNRTMRQRFEQAGIDRNEYRSQYQWGGRGRVFFQ